MGATCGGRVMHRFSGFAGRAGLRAAQSADQDDERAGPPVTNSAAIASAIGCPVADS
jgi:hypothetical protein